ncbi:MAG: glycosyltransferase [Vulcanisaeta sp.]|nr:glycosyltransferase [Vulcanisaeta sp.]
MRVCIVSSSMYPVPTWRFTGYGSEIVNWWLADYLKNKAGIDVVLFAPYSSVPPKNVEFYAIPPSYTLVNYDREYFVYEKYLDVVRRCDVIHDWSATALSAEYEFKHGKPFIISRNGYDITNPRFNKKNIVVLSDAVRRYMQVRYGINPEVVHYGIPVDEYPFGEVKGNYVLYVGRPHPSKGIDFILELARLNKDVTFILAWKPTSADHYAFHEYYINRVNELGLRNVRIYVLPGGWEGEWMKRKLMAHAKLFIQPTVYLEAFGLTAAEALATGTPLLLSTAGSGPEIVKDSSVGVLVKNKLTLIEQAERWVDMWQSAIDVDELNAVFRDAISRRWNYKAIREYAKQYFDISVMANKYMKLYERAIAGERW